MFSGFLKVSVRSMNYVRSKIFQPMFALGVRNLSGGRKIRDHQQLIKWGALFTTAVTGITVTELYLRHMKNSVICEAIIKDPKTVFVKGMKLDVKDAVHLSRNFVEDLQKKVGAPGIVVAVSVDGELVWKEGFGYSDLENHVFCTPDTVMRIASISKSLTLTAVAKLWEDGKLDFDKPVQEYVPTFPEKSFEGEKVTITLRHLVSHLSGIRHYELTLPSEKQKKENKNENQTKEQSSLEDLLPKKKNLEEIHNKESYQTVVESLNMFKDDPLHYKPGSKYLYTTHGFTLVSAVTEAAAKVPFTALMTKLFKELGLENTFLDVNEPLIYNRSRCYIKQKGLIVNAPYVDNSYKWAGGGFLSTVGDLVKFGNAMLYSFQYKPTCKELPSSKDESNVIIKAGDDRKPENESVRKNTKQQLPGYLKPETVKMVWTPVIPTNSSFYGMGWVIKPETQMYAMCARQDFSVYHTGGAVGASSVLLIVPRNVPANVEEKVDVQSGNRKLPQGIVVSLITNLSEISLSNLALKIAEVFSETDI